MPAKSKNLVVVISSHGYGHAAMTAPLVQALCKKCPDLKVTVRTDIPGQFLQTVMPFTFEHIKASTDFGMVMHDAFRVDTQRSLSRYQTFHQNWQDKINTEVERLTQLQADYLISNIAYLPLAAAKQMGIPAIAYGCLNWAEIFQHYFMEHDQIYRQIIDAYVSADCIIRTQPAMPMTSLATETVGPIATTGINRRQLLLNKLALVENTRLILVSMGGIKTVMNIKHWPVIEGIHYLTDDPAPHDREDISSLSNIGISIIDALCSVDLFLTKPGYGSFSQAACNRTPVLYVERPDWPEHSYLCDWLKNHITCASITQQQFCDGQFSSKLIALLRQDVSPTIPQPGLTSAVNLLLKSFNIDDN